jgi:hypothetical protein
MFSSQTWRRLAVLGGVFAATCLAGTDARAEGGRLVVKSSPAGASVYLDAESEPRGVTPLELSGVATGLHKIRVTLAGHIDQKRGFYLTAGGERKFDFTLEADEVDTPELVAPQDEPRLEPKPEPKKKKPVFKKKVKVPRTIDVDCPYCKGSKVLKEMGCSRCKGSGYIGADQCDTCGGSRRVEFGCPYCKGEGVIVVRGKERDCKKCKGEGNLPCPPCRGSGQIQRINPETAKYPITDCRYCDATGFAKEAKCTFCGGDGNIQIGVANIVRRAGRGRFVGGGTREKVSCPYCAGEGKGAPLCSRCQGRAYQGSGPCVGCYGTGLSFIQCGGCRGRAFVRARK